MDTSVTRDRIIDVAYGYRSAKALLTAVELGVFTTLAGGALDAEALRQQVSIEQRGARDFFDALVALRFIDRDAQGRYTNTPEAATYLDRNKPAYVGGLLENLNAREYGHWSALTEALRTGKPQTGFSAPHHFGALYSESGRLRRFAKGMTGATIAPAQALAKRFPWGDYRTLVDVGTAEGCLPIQIPSEGGRMDGLLAKLAFAAVIVARFPATIVLISRRADVYATPSKSLTQKAQHSSKLRLQTACHRGIARTRAVVFVQSALHNG